MRQLSIAFSALSLAACSAEKPAEPTEPAIEGYRGLKFGASFKAVVGDLGHEPFNPSGMKDCFDNMATEGCFLSPKEDTTYFDMQGGIPYALGLRFSKYDRLFQISLQYHREGSVDRTACLDVFGRTLDWVKEEYGPFAPSKGMTGDFTFVEGRSPNGIVYPLGVTKDQFFNSSLDRGLGGRRRVWIMGTFIIVDAKPICMVNVNFVDDSLESVPGAGRTAE